jgi:hypothetical protein
LPRCESPDRARSTDPPLPLIAQSASGSFASSFETDACRAYAALGAGQRAWCVNSAVGVSWSRASTVRVAMLLARESERVVAPLELTIVGGPKRERATPSGDARIEAAATARGTQPLTIGK